MPKDDEIRNISVRRKNILYLMQRYLQDNGFYAAAETLKADARISEEFELCDNVDLDSIYLDYASYYHLKFGKYPKILRKAAPVVKAELSVAKKKKIKAQQLTELQHSPPMVEQPSNEFQITITSLEPSKDNENSHDNLRRLQEVEHGVGYADNALLTNIDWQQLADLVKTTILREDFKLNWTDICGNCEAIDIIKEAVMAPINHPKLFENGLRPWKSVLLHGPPGSGKTLLAKVLYAETSKQVTFFNVTSSIIISKWRGESEKILRMLFHVAQQKAPAIIFLDEIEGLTSKRDRPSDHESSKRFKNELLQLLDGMEDHTANVFILASTNLPWDIDEAFLRRFEKKLLVQLPNGVERAKLIRKLLPITIQLSEAEVKCLVDLSNHFTGDEIRLACKDIAMQVVRSVIRGKGAAEQNTFGQAFEKIKPLSLKLMKRHEDWQQEHGSK